MQPGGGLFRALGIDPRERGAIRALSRSSGVPVARLRHYNDANLLPSGEDLERIVAGRGVDPTALMLAMGRPSRDLLAALAANAREVAALIGRPAAAPPRDPCPRPEMQTGLGRLYRGDCLAILPTLPCDSVDMIFADPPFNLGKRYPSGIDDERLAEAYLAWCEEWLGACVRLLKHGGSLLVWNLPKWNTQLAAFLAGRMTFLHWIAVDIKYRLPISGRLYPAHYSLLYFAKGERPRVFHPDRLPMPICPHCYGDLRDYGGYKDKMNPKGVNLSDVWADIAPVRHARHKRRAGANELSLKLMDRVIEMTTDPGDLVLDPFGGAGTTYMAAELKGRRWIGVEIGPTDDIARRFAGIEGERERLAGLRSGANALFTETVRQGRERRGWWTCESVRCPSGDPGRCPPAGGRADP